MPTFSRLVLLALALALALAGCGQPSHEALLSVYDAPGGEYRVRYLEPPWNFVAAEGTRAEFRIDANAVVHGGLDDAGIAPKYELVVTFERGAPMAFVRREQAAAEGRRAEILVSSHEIETALGEVGWEVATKEAAVDGRYRRAVFLAHPSGTVAIRFESTVELLDPEIDVMIDDVDVAPEDTP